MASLERRLLLRFIHIFNGRQRADRSLEEADDGDSTPGPEESALAILLSLHGDVVSFEGSVYRREGLSVVVHREVPCLDPDAAEVGSEPAIVAAPAKQPGLVSQPRKRK